MKVIQCTQKESCNEIKLIGLSEQIARVAPNELFRKMCECGVCPVQVIHALKFKNFPVNPIKK